MKSISPLGKAALAAVLVGCYLFKRKKRSSFPFDPQKACENIRPFDTLIEFANRFEKKHESSRETISFDKGSVPTSITYNRDAFIALINAPEAEKVRVYLALNDNRENSQEGDLVLCFFPVDKSDNLIRAKLVGCEPNPNDNHLKALSLSASVAAGAALDGAEALDDGQRKP